MVLENTKKEKIIITKHLKTNKIMKDEFWNGFFLGILVTIELVVIMIMI
jgi:hypothetical protein